MDDPAEHVADVLVDSEEVLRLVNRAAKRVDARRGQLLRPVLHADQDELRVVCRDLVGEQGDQQEEYQDDQAHVALRWRRMLPSVSRQSELPRGRSS